MDTTPDNTPHATTLDAHLESIQKMLHELQKSRKQDTLTPLAMTQALQQVHSNFTRDFPLEHSFPIAESSVQDLLADYLQRAQRRKVAAPTGLSGLDMALNGGFQSKRLVVLLGAPGSGKTSFANQMAERVAQERPVLYVTSEDVPDVLLAKTLSRLGNIKYSAVLYGWEKYEADIKRAIETLAERPSAQLLRYLDVTAGAISMDELRDRAQAHFQGKTGPGLIIIDYLQRMARAIRESAGVKELREAVTSLTEQLRGLACELDCSVLAVASMNRQSGYGKSGDVSALSSAKESGDIEYTADVIMALVEDTVSKRTTSSFIKPRVLRLDKNRLGETTTIDLDWYADRQQFTEANKEGR